MCCVGGAREKNWTIIFLPNSFHLSQPGPLIHPSGVPRRHPASWPGSSSPPSLSSPSNFGFFPLHRRHPALSPPPSSHPSLSFHLPPIILFYTIPLTSDPRHHPNLSKKTVPSFPSPLYFSPFRVRARLSSLHTLIETFNAAPLRRGPPLIVSLPSPPNTLVPQQTTDRPTEPNLRLTTCPAH